MLKGSVLPEGCGCGAIGQHLLQIIAVTSTFCVLSSAGECKIASLCGRGKEGRQVQVAGRCVCGIQWQELPYLSLVFFFVAIFYLPKRKIGESDKYRPSFTNKKLYRLTSEATAARCATWADPPCTRTHTSLSIRYKMRMFIRETCSPNWYNWYLSWINDIL